MWPFLLSLKPLRPGRESADAYVKRVGPHQALKNAEAVFGQARKDDGFTSPRWEQIRKIATKQIEEIGAA
jgi:hypothetical protein